MCCMCVGALCSRSKQVFIASWFARWAALALILGHKCFEKWTWLVMVHRMCCLLSRLCSLGRRIPGPLRCRPWHSLEVWTQVLLFSAFAVFQLTHCQLALGMCCKHYVYQAPPFWLARGHGPFNLGDIYTEAFLLKVIENAKLCYCFCYRLCGNKS